MSSPVQPSDTSRRPICSSARSRSLSVRREMLPSCSPSSPATSRWLIRYRHRRPKSSRSSSPIVPSQSRAASTNASCHRAFGSDFGARSSGMATSSSGSEVTPECWRSFDRCQFWNTRMSHGASGRWPS